jgi:hypothetical protein
LKGAPGVYEIQSMVAMFLESGIAAVFGWPTIIGATGIAVPDSLSTDFPSGVPSQPYANPI